MAIKTALNCTLDTTHAMSTRTAASENYSLDLETNWSCEQSKAMHVSYGAGSSTTAGNLVSTARYSAMRAPTYRAPSFAKRMQSLMQSGLIAGITPTSIAQRSHQRILAFVSSWPAGDGADGPQAANSCLSACDRPNVKLTGTLRWAGFGLGF